MVVSDVWRETGLAANATVAEIKVAYAALIKRYRPDSHPHQFAAARQGYENAIRRAGTLEQQALARAARQATAADAPLPDAQLERGGNRSLPDRHASQAPDAASDDSDGCAPSPASAASSNVGTAGIAQEQRSLQRWPVAGSARAPEDEIALPTDRAELSATLAAHRLMQIEGDALELLRECFIETVRQMRLGTLDRYADFENHLIRWLLTSSKPQPFLVLLGSEQFGWQRRAAEVANPLPPLLEAKIEVAQIEVHLWFHPSRLVRGLVRQSSPSRWFEFFPYLDAARNAVQNARLVQQRSAALARLTLFRSDGLADLQRVRLRSTDLLILLLLGPIFGAGYTGMWRVVFLALMLGFGPVARWLLKNLPAQRFWRVDLIVLKRTPRKSRRAVAMVFFIFVAMMLVAGLVLSQDHPAAGSAILISLLILLTPWVWLAIGRGEVALWWFFDTYQNAHMRQKASLFLSLATKAQGVAAGETLSQAWSAIAAAKKKQRLERQTRQAMAAGVKPIKPKSGRGSLPKGALVLIFFVISGLGRLIAGIDAAGPVAPQVPALPVPPPVHAPAPRAAPAADQAGVAPPPLAHTSIPSGCRLQDAVLAPLPARTTETVEVDFSVGSDHRPHDLHIRGGRDGADVERARADTLRLRCDHAAGTRLSWLRAYFALGQPVSTQR